MELNFGNFGIWGYGVVGKSFLRFLSKFDREIFVYDKNVLSADQKLEIESYGAKVLQNENEFLCLCDKFFVSPGVNISSYKIDSSKIFSELDLLTKFYSKSVFALTGSIGKTSTVTLLGKLINQQKKFAVCGNIGDPLLDFVFDESYQGLLIELSSFQLEYSKKFAPDLAVLTNFYANHLDRHVDEKNYLDAKLNILKYQSEKQICILPLAIKNKLDRKKIKSQLNFFTTDDAQSLDQSCGIFSIKNNNLIYTKNAKSKVLWKDIKNLNQTYLENYIVALASMYLMNFDFSKINFDFDLTIPHRLEKFCEINGVEFYNDSKSTVSESTLAAVNKFKPEEVVLILGGLSKGVDREPMIKLLKDKVSKIYLFGKEADDLKLMCDKFQILNTKSESLDELVSDLLASARVSNKILFSPAGSSYDLFKNYQHRGDVFKELVLNHSTKN